MSENEGTGWGKAIALIVVTVLAVVAISVALAAVLANRGSSKHEPETVTYVIPKGTSKKVAAGETVTIMPDEVRLQVGDRLVIRNEDAETATVGPYTVRSGETLRQWFRSPQTLVGECSVAESGTVKIIVT